MSEASGYQITSDAARAREQYSVRYFMAPWAPVLVAAAALQPGERVLDLACGSGLIARIAAPQLGPEGRITGLDINASMLEVARSLPPPAGAPIAWVQASADATGLPDAAFDVVLCQQGFQFFPDKPAARAKCIACWRRAGGSPSASGKPRVLFSSRSRKVSSATSIETRRRSFVRIAWCRTPRRCAACSSQPAFAMSKSVPAR